VKEEEEKKEAKGEIKGRAPVTLYIYLSILSNKKIIK